MGGIESSIMQPELDSPILQRREIWSLLWEALLEDPDWDPTGIRPRFIEALSGLFDDVVESHDVPLTFDEDAWAEMTFFLATWGIACEEAEAEVQGLFTAWSNDDPVIHVVGRSWQLPKLSWPAWADRTPLVMPSLPLPIPYRPPLTDRFDLQAAADRAASEVRESILAQADELDRQAMLSTDWHRSSPHYRGERRMGTLRRMATRFYRAQVCRWTYARICDEEARETAEEAPCTEASVGAMVRKVRRILDLGGRPGGSTSP